MALTSAALLWLCLVSLARGTLFTVTHDRYVNIPCALLNRQNIKSLSLCVAMCEQLPACRLGSWLRGAGGSDACCLDYFLPIHTAPALVEDVGSAYFVREPQTDFRYFEDGWRLIYKAQGGSGVSIYDSWGDSSHTEDTQNNLLNVLTGAWSLQKQPSFGTPSRSHVIDDWDVSNITEVRLSVYREGSEVGHVVFDVTPGSTTASTWMNKNRITSSSWTDMVPSAIYFCSVTGDSTHGRHFYISHAHGGCGIDSGWLVVVENNGPSICHWEMLRARPTILYSRGTTVQTFSTAHSNNYGVADVLAVFVKEQ